VLHTDRIAHELLLSSVFLYNGLTAAHNFRVIVKVSGQPPLDRDSKRGRTRAVYVRLLHSIPTVRHILPHISSVRQWIIISS